MIHAHLLPAGPGPAGFLRSRGCGVGGQGNGGFGNRKKGKARHGRRSTVVFTCALLMGR